MSEEKFSKCGEGEKNVSVEFRVFGKKNGNWKKSSGKKIKVFWVLKLKLRLQRKFKIRDFYLLGSYPLFGLYVVKHGLSLKSWKLAFQEKKCSGRGCPLSWAPCCEWTKSWVPCCERTRNILSWTLGGSFACVYTRGPWAVEYLAKLSRILKIFPKSFKAMILGFDFI